MEGGQTVDGEEPNKDPGDEEEEEEEEKEGSSLDWLMKKKDIIEITPMDSNVLTSSFSSVDNICTRAFTRERVFEAASQGDSAQLDGLLDYLRLHDLRLTSPEYTDESNGKTALLKALLNLNDGKNDTIEVLLDVAEKTADLENLVNASYKDICYKGQTPLHVAIERRSFDHVKLLVQKGADVQAKANGEFFQRKAGLGFYFGELPLSLAACTNQPDMVSFLMENPFRKADLADRDSQGNTVFHTLVVIADNTTENTEMVAKMYDEILVQHNKLEKTDRVKLEAIENNQGLTSLKLAAKLGKIGLFTHILQREFEEEEMRPLCRKLTEWVYGPVRSSLYDMTSIDTSEDNSVLEIVVFGSEIPNRPEMLQIEPLRSLLQDKWDRFASRLFLMNFLVYLLYVSIFTTVAYNRKVGQPPFAIENVLVDGFRCTGEIFSVLGAVWFLYKAIMIFRKNPPNFKALYTDGFSDILFFLQAILLLVCTVVYMCGRREYVGLLVLSLALAWINVLYYSRGSKQMGIYNVMMQRMILGDILHFLCVFGVLLFGFSAAIVSLMEDTVQKNGSVPPGKSLDVKALSEKPTYNNIRFTILEMFKFTVGMGDLQFTDHIQHKEVFYILLISYIVLTYILLLNMLIALMGNTVDRISKESENIWNLQRAITILDMERTVPRCLRSKLFSGETKMVCPRGQTDECRRFFRVEEMNWRQWRSHLGGIREEDPGNDMMQSQPRSPTPRTPWNLSPLLKRIRIKRHQPQNFIFP